MNSREDRYWDIIYSLANKYQAPAYDFAEIEDPAFTTVFSKLCTINKKHPQIVLDDLREARAKMQQIRTEDETLCYQQLDEYGEDLPTPSNE